MSVNYTDDTKVPVSMLIDSFCEGIRKFLSNELSDHDPDSCKRWGSGFSLGRGKNLIVVTWEAHVGPHPSRRKPWLKEGDRLPNPRFAEKKLGGKKAAAKNHA